ncbi:hypothetical protein JCM10450v2_002344 [Rhodotorula kratochvilovae]
MRSALAIASLVSLSSVALAQSGYGRFPCTLFNGDGTLSPDPNQCLDGALIAPGFGDGSTGFQGDEPNPTGAECVPVGGGAGYFCGVQFAACTTDANCDNGRCVNGQCSGRLAEACGADTECLGFLYCTDPEINLVGTCGGDGVFCTDPSAGIEDGTAAENYDTFNQYCVSGYCSVNAGGICTNHVTLVGVDCSFDPEFACTVDTFTGAALTCDPTSLTCQLAPQPTGARARARRAAANGGEALFKRRACPLSHTACSIEGAKGFECIDTQSNLEQCGACATEGGVDCTTLPGVESVGCVAGTCEIWSCADGYNWDAATSTCVAALA